MKRFLFRFCVFFMAGFTFMLSPTGTHWIGLLTQGLTRVVAAIIQAAGGHATAAGNVLASPGQGFSMQIANGCDGCNVLLLLWAAMLSWPAGVADRARGLLIALVVVQVANMIRLIALFYCGQWNSTWFEWVHLYFAEILIMLLGLVTFGAWIRQITPTLMPDRAR